VLTATHYDYVGFELGASASSGRAGAMGDITGHTTGHITGSGAYRLLPSSAPGEPE
jgi:hypothetical protein